MRRLALAAAARLACADAGTAGAAAGETHPTTALVLSGGGAKGAYEVGALQRICEGEHANSWSMITGTSIGALNAGALAQWPQAEQCSKGVNASLLSYWQSIQILDDVMIAGHSSITGSVESCFSAGGSVSMYDNLLDHGGLCDPSPGHTAYRARVDASKIHSSGMKLSVVSSSLLTAKPVWFDETHDDIIDGCIASGAIAPLVWPVHTRKQWFVDGGIFHNTPILQALKRGATSLLVICLDSDDNVPLTNATMKDQNVGPDIVNYYIQVATQEYMVRNELTAACRDYPHASIMGIVPSSFVGDLLGFTSAKIEEMRAKGYEDAAGPLIDLCEGYARRPAGTGGGGSGGGSGPRTDVVLAAVLGVVGGVVLAVLVSQGLAWKRRRKLAAYQYGIKSPGSGSGNLRPVVGNGQYQRW